MDGGCRASSLGVLINKLSQSCKAPSNRLPLPLFPSLNPPPSLPLGSQTLDVLLSKSTCYRGYAHRRMEISAIQTSRFLLLHSHDCARPVSRRLPTARALTLLLTSSLQTVWRDDWSSPPICSKNAWFSPCNPWKMFGLTLKRTSRAVERIIATFKAPWYLIHLSNLIQRTRNSQWCLRNEHSRGDSSLDHYSLYYKRWLLHVIFSEDYFRLKKK